MTEADVWRIVWMGVDYDSLVFIWVGQFGSQPVLMPNKVYRWHSDDATPESSEPRPLVLPRHGE